MTNKINDGGAAFAELLNKNPDKIDIWDVVELQPYFLGDEMKVIISLLSNGIKALTSPGIIETETGFTASKTKSILSRMTDKGILVKELDKESPWQNTPFCTPDYFYQINPYYQLTVFVHTLPKEQS